MDKHKNEVFDSQQFKQELKYLSDFSWDAIQTIRTISIYSTRAKDIYDEFLSIRSSDDILQSIEPTHKQSTALFYKVLQALYLK